MFFFLQNICKATDKSKHVSDSFDKMSLIFSDLKTNRIMFTSSIFWIIPRGQDLYSKKKVTH